MNQNRLFNVLVMGGLTVLGSTTTRADSFPSEVEAGNSSIQTELNQLEDPEMPQVVFCNTEEAKTEVCVLGCNGKSQPKKGFVCCWGTSCE